MKITDTLITTLLKHGLVGEMKDFKTEIEIPGETDDDASTMITVTAQSVQIRMDREDR